MTGKMGGESGLSRTVLVVTGSAVVLAALAAFLTLRSPGPATESEPGTSVTADGTIVLSEAASREAGIGVEAAKTVTRRDQLVAPGTMAFDERRTARIGSPVEGKVVEVFSEIGDRVKAGTDLAHMISPLVHEAWAGYRTAVAERRKAETELQFARQADERMQRLFAAKAVSEQDVERARTNRVAAEEQLNIAQTEVRRGEEELEHLGVTNSEDPSGESGEQIPVRSPLNGVVLERLITQGGAVTPGTPLFVVSDLSSLWALAEIDETALPHVKAGLPVEVQVSAYPTERFPGQIAWVADTINPKTRRVTVRCTVPNAANKLKPDMYATITLGESDPRELVAVPTQAVQELEGKPALFVQVSPGRFARRFVTVGADVDGWIEVTSGVKAGERVVTSGAFLLKSELLKPASAGE